MTEDDKFIEDAVLIFFNKYPHETDARYSLDELCIYLTRFLPILGYVNFKNDLKRILESLISDNYARCIVSHNLTSIPPSYKSSYYLTGTGEAKSKIQNSTIDAFITTPPLKDMIALNFALYYFPPFLRFTAREFNGIIEDVENGFEDPKKMMAFDPKTSDRIFKILRTEGFVREYESERFKFTKRGKRLIEAGEYTEFISIEQENKNKELRREKSNDLLMETNLASGKIQSSLLAINHWIASGTIAQAVIALVLLFSGVLKNLHWVGAVYFWTVLFVFFLGIMSGIAALLIIYKLSQKKE